MNAGPVHIGQKISDTKGAHYVLCFWLAGNPDGGPSVKTAKFAFAPNGLSNSHTFSFNTAGHSITNMGWVLKTYRVVGSGADSLVFTGLSPNDAFGATIDTVSLRSASKPIPKFVTGTTAAFIEGTRGRFDVRVHDIVSASFAWQGVVPTGLTLVNNGEGSSATLSGIPAVGTHGTYNLSLTAVDTTGAHAAQTLKVVVRPISAKVPIVTSITPTSSGPANITITGKNFVGTTAVDFGTVKSAAFAPNAQGTSMTAKVPTGATGTVDVTVTSPHGTSPITLGDRFTYNVAPQPPDIVSVRPLGKSMSVSWTPNPTSDQVTQYNLTAVVLAAFQAGAPAGCAAPVTGHAPGTSSSAVLPACAGVPYAVTMTAQNAFGVSVASATSSTVVPMGTQPPSPPLITTVEPRPGSLIVNWAPPATDGGDPAISYTLTAAPTDGSKVTGGIVTPTVSTTSTTGTYLNLTDGTTYLLSLTASNSAGTSRPSTATGTPSPSSPPGPVSSLGVTPTTAGNQHNIVVSWSPPLDVGSGTGLHYSVNYWTTLPGPACATTTTSILPDTWQAPASLSVAAVPGCAAGFTSVTIGSHLLAAGQVGSSLDLASGGGFAITAAEPVVFVVPTVQSTSSTSVTLVNPPSANYYGVTVTAVTTAGPGQATVSNEPVTATVSKAPNATILSSAFLKNCLLSEITDIAGNGHYLLFKKQKSHCTFNPTLHAGMVLIGTATPADPGGILDVVQSVSTDPAGDVVVDVTPASASGAFDSMSFSSSGTPPGGVAQTYQAVGAGVGTPAAHSRSSGSGDPTLPVHWDLGPVSIDGQVALTPSVDLGASLRCNARFLGVCYSFDASVTAGASLEASASLSASIDSGDDPYEIPIVSIDFGCICFAIGPVPVAIFPKLDVHLDLSGSATIEVSAKVAVSGSVGWDSSNGFSTSSSTSTSASGGPLVEPAANATATGTADLSVEFELCLYDVLCGIVQADGVLTATAQYELNPPPNYAYFSVCPELDIKAGINIDFLFWNPSKEWTLATFTPTPACWEVTSPPVTLSISPAAATINAGGSQQLTSSRNDSNTPTDNWTLLNPISSSSYPPGDTISGTGLVTSCCTGGNRTLVVEDTDSSTPSPVGPAYATITIGGNVAFDPPGFLTLTPGGSAAGTLNKPTNLTIGWSTPAATGGAPIDHYDVTVNGVTTQTSADSLVVPIPSVVAVSYTVEVTAVNTSGLTSPPDSTTVLIPSPYAFDAPGNLQVVGGNSGGGHTMTVAWTAPVQTGTSVPAAIKFFEVSVNGAVTDITTSPYTQSIPAASHTYTVVVVAVNQDGLTSPGASAVVSLP